MNNLTFEQLKKAYAAGATIQITNGSDGWFDLDKPRFDATKASDYRIKPTEKTSGGLRP